MMQLRDYRPSDRPALEAMFRAQGYEYVLPDISDEKLFITRLILVDEHDKPVQAVLGRLTSEAYFLEDPKSAGPVIRMRRFLALEEAACDRGRRAGLDSVHVWLPPEVETTKFGSQLERLNWKEFTWRTFCKEL
jgi:hypothetical protein